MFGRIPLSGPGLLFPGSWVLFCFFSLTDSFSLLVISLFKLAGCMFLETCPFLLGCPICWHITVNSIIILCISLVSVISPLSLLILFIWVFSLLLDVLDKGLSVLFSFQKISSCFHWLFLLFFLNLCFVYFLSDLNYFLPSADFWLCLFFF